MVLFGVYSVSQISIQRVSNLIQRRYVISAITIRIISLALHVLLLEVTHSGEIPFLEHTCPNMRLRATLSGVVVVGLLPCGRTKPKVSHSSIQSDQSSLPRGRSVANLEFPAPVADL